MLRNPLPCHRASQSPRLSPTTFTTCIAASFPPQLSIAFSSSISSSPSLHLPRHNSAARKRTHALQFQFQFLVRCTLNDPLKVIISGAPASGKGTQCKLIVQKFGLVHISTGDLLRAEVAAETEIGVKAKEYINSGRLVPDEIVTAMVRARLSLRDAKEKGWLLDGYPRTSAQAQSLENLGIRPDVYIVLEVTSRLENYKLNVEAIVATYANVMKKIDGNRSKEVIFEELKCLLSQKLDEKENAATRGNAVTKGSGSNLASPKQDKWRGIPTRLNNIPHSREIREYFYDDVLHATLRAVNDGKTRLKVEISIPELNPATDVYRIGTLMELVRVIALTFADDGKRVKVCVQGSMGEGALAGMPLQLAGTRKILEFMDWGDYGAKGTFINIGSIGGNEVGDEDDMFILVAPQNAIGNCIINDLRAMTDAAGSRPVILVNPRLKDVPGSSGIMQTMGRDKRMEYAASFETCYSFRLLYYAGTQYPIMGALRMSYPSPYEVYKRLDDADKKEKYVMLYTFETKPTPDDINNAFLEKPREVKDKPSVWDFLSSILG